MNSYWTRDDMSCTLRITLEFDERMLRMTGVPIERFVDALRWQAGRLLAEFERSARDVSASPMLAPRYMQDLVDRVDQEIMNGFIEPTFVKRFIEPKSAKPKPKPEPKPEPKPAKPRDFPEIDL